MADKEATVYVVDMGKTMAETRHGRDKTDLDWCMEYVWDKITTTIATGRKTACLGVVGFRTDETKHDLSEVDGYDNILLLQPLGQALMPDIRSLSEKINPSKTTDGDAISAVVVALTMLERFTKKLKYQRKIVLVTDGRGPLDPDDIDSIATKIKEDGVDLVILGADFDDPDWGVKEESKDPAKKYNEDHLKSLADKCDGVFGTIQQAITEMSVPRVKRVRPVPSYKGILTLGNPREYETAMAIDVERYPRTMIAKAPSASNLVIKADDDQTQTSSATAVGQADKEGDIDMDRKDNGDLAALQSNQLYQVADESAPGGKREVNRDQLAKGYEYGRTAVHISESEENVTKFEADQGLDIVGFIPAENYHHYMNLSRSNVIIAQRSNNKAVLALSSFIHTLYELGNYAVARLVVKDGKAPVLLVLAPSIEPGFECLIDIELPFAEDVRNYKFPPLDRIPTVSGKVLTEHRNLPNPDLMQAMGTYVDAMDLTLSGRTDEGEPAEYMAMEDTFSPVLHRINQAIGFKAVHPNDTVPPPAPILTKYMNAPEDLLEKAKKSVDGLKTAADVKKVPPKSLSKRNFRNARAAEQPRSGLDVDALLKSRSAQNNNRISPDNAIPEFKQLLSDPSDLSIVHDGVSQMGAIVEKWITESMGDSNYARVCEALGVMREECTELEEPKAYNEFVSELRKKLLDGSLGGDRREMWWRLRVNKLGLIETRVAGGATAEESTKFYAGK